MGIPGIDGSLLQRGVEALEKLAAAQAGIHAIEQQKRREERTQTRREASQDGES